MPSPVRSATATPAGPGEARALVGGVDLSAAWKVPLPLPSSHRDRVGGVVGDDQVGDAVAVDVRHRHIARAGAGGDDDLRLKRAVAVVQQDADRVGALVDGQDVKPAVVGHVGQRDTPHPRSDGIGLGRLKGAVAVAQKHAHRVVDPVGGDDVGDAVAVQVPHRHRVGARSGGERGEGQTGLGERRGEPVSTRARLLRDGQQVRPRLQRLDDLTAVRLDQHLARRSGQRQPGQQRAAGGGDLRLQLPVAQRAADRERPGAHLVRAAAFPWFP